ncbi:DUF6934 family protein [Pedobacter frigoris]|uniref:DUF6934 family protein n=1 Tax=Pedobacter frigoris TaxID=2571272 RepID=UPI00292F61C6|nr:hypothetical protein [Pedobacter frigoris]
MNKERYDIVANPNRTVFEFNSDGPNGTIKKEIQYTLVNAGGFFYYNLGFGDLNADTGDINDLSVSDNKDRDKILATVAHTVIQFTEHMPNAMVYAKGSTPARTRLYQMAISRNYDNITELLAVHGRVNGRWYQFEKDVNYEAFMALRK